MNPGTRLGSYEIQDTIAAGGMGVVYRAHHTALGKQVAIKVLASNLAVREKVRMRFQQEAYVQAQLDHPGVVNVRDLIIDGSTLAIIMDFVDGPDLNTALEEESPGPWPLDMVAAVVGPLMSAIAYAHGRGVAHRDIKPSNVLLDRSHGATWPGRVRVTDFGLAKILSSDVAMTRAGSRMGTVPYMAPEQFMGERETDTRVDVFALAMVLYRMLTGKLPVNADNALEVAEMYAGRTPLEPIEVEGVPDALAKAVMTGLSLDPAQRPIDGAAFAQLVMPHLPTEENWQAPTLTDTTTSPIRGAGWRNKTASSIQGLGLDRLKKALSNKAAQAGKTAGQVNAKIPRIRLSDYIGGFDWRLGLAGLLCMLVYFVPVHSIPIWDTNISENGEETPEIKTRFKDYSRLHDEKPTRKSLKEAGEDFERGDPAPDEHAKAYITYRSVSLIMGFGFLCLFASFLRNRARAIPMILITLFSCFFVYLIYDDDVVRKMVIRVFDNFYDEPWAERKDEYRRTEIFYSFQQLGAIFLCALMGYRIGLLKWARLHINWFALILGIIAIGLFVFPYEWLDWDHILGHGDDPVGSISDWETVPYFNICAGVFTIFALIPGRLGAAWAAMGVLVVALSPPLTYYYKFEQIVLPYWREEDIGFSLNILQQVAVETGVFVIVCFAMALVGSRLAAPTWWNDPTPEGPGEETGEEALEEEVSVGEDIPTDPETISDITSMKEG